MASSTPADKPKVHLPVIVDSTGAARRTQTTLEALLGACAPHDAAHLRAWSVSADTVEGALESCIAPSVRAPLVECVRRLRSIATKSAQGAALQRVRQSVRDAAPAAREQTLQAIRESQRGQPARQATLLDPHAAAVVWRYVALAATHATSCVELLTDGLVQPRELARVPLQAAGALAYRNAGLGSALDPAFRQLACDEAERQRDGSMPGVDSVGALAIQLLHEYLGAVWKDHADAQRLHNEALLEAAVRASE